MIPGVTAWVRTLVALALLANVVDWLMPPGSLRRYVGLVAGLFMTAALVGPVSALVSRGPAPPDWARWFRQQSGPALGAVIARQEAVEVEAVLGTLPGVAQAVVHPRADGVVTVTVTTTAKPPPTLATAARTAVEEVMTVPPQRIRIVVIPSDASQRGGAGT